MSHEGSVKSSNSHSESSNSSSPNQAVLLQQQQQQQNDSKSSYTDLTLFGAPAPTRLSRTGTVRRASSIATTLRKDKETNITVEEYDNSPVKNGRTLPENYASSEKIRKSLDNTYRHSLESISEYKTKSSFSSVSLYPSLDCGSLDSSSSDCTDYAIRSTTSDTNKDDKTFMSPSSSYLSWIESVNSEYFGSATSTAEVVDVDNKVGEWNNFWLNYNSARNKYLSSQYLCASNEERTVDDISDAKSTCSTQREFTEKNSTEQIILSVEEVTEVLRCSQRITEILQNALKRNDLEIDDSRNDSYYSQAFSQHANSVKEEVKRERSFSYVIETELQKQKHLLKPTPQSSSSSCINALLNTGVADILKRVITKRRDVMAPDDSQSGSRSSFSDWSNTK